jgi:NADPH:quinone reductase-like Zn-dependent oxidoreductase
VKAACIETTGTPDVIRYADLPDPVPGPGEVLVRVAAVTVNPIDLYIRAGTVAMPLPKPFIIGCDLAGTIVGLGPHAGRFCIGDRVWGSNPGLRISIAIWPVARCGLPWGGPSLWPKRRRRIASWRTTRWVGRVSWLARSSSRSQIEFVKRRPLGCGYEL